MLTLMKYSLLLIMILCFSLPANAQSFLRDTDSGLFGNDKEEDGGGGVVNQYDPRFKGYVPPVGAVMPPGPDMHIEELPMETSIFDGMEDIIVLRAPKAAMSSDTRLKLLQIADDFGLEIYDGPISGDDDLYFTDPGGETLGKIGPESIIKLAMMEIDDIFTGAHGDYAVPRAIEVFAHRAGVTY